MPAGRHASSCGLARFLLRQPIELPPQFLARFFVRRVQRNTIDRADFDALRPVEMAHALGAFARIDEVNFLALRNRTVRALRLANVAIDAGVGNHQRHKKTRLPVGLACAARPAKAHQFRCEGLRDEG